MFPLTGQFRGGPALDFAILRMSNLACLLEFLILRNQRVRPKDGTMSKSTLAVKGEAKQSPDVHSA